MASRLWNWLLRPIGRATELKRRLIFRALRSRLFLIIAILTSIPAILSAASATWKAQLGNADAGPMWMWVAALSFWLIFVMTVALEHWYLEQRAKRKRERTLSLREMNRLKKLIDEQSQLSDRT